MNLASTTLLNNKRKLQCGGQHASSKTFETCTHFMDKKKKFILLHLYKKPISKGSNKIDNERFKSVDI